MNAYNSRDYISTIIFIPLVFLIAIDSLDQHNEVTKGKFFLKMLNIIKLHTKIMIVCLH